MNKVFIIGIIISVPIISLSLSKRHPVSQISMAYCPTMANLAQSVSHVEGIRLVEYETTGEILNEINQGKIDIALVGRKAKPTEKTSLIQETQLDPEAATLITNIFSYIDINELEFLPIRHEIEQELISKSFSHLNLVEEDAVASLVYWRQVDYQDHDLLVPVNTNGEKEITFRTPFIYSAQGIDKDIKSIIINSIQENYHE